MEELFDGILTAALVSRWSTSSVEESVFPGNGILIPATFEFGSLVRLASGLGYGTLDSLEI